jgi:hypothetical protein
MKESAIMGLRRCNMPNKPEQSLAPPLLTVTTELDDDDNLEQLWTNVGQVSANADTLISFLLRDFEVDRAMVTSLRGV